MKPRATSRLTGTTVVLVGAAIGCRPVEAPTAACLQIDSPAAPIGFDAPFSIAVRWSCREVPDAEITWRQVDGAPLRALTLQSKGFRLTARTPPLHALFGAARPWGLVPFSPRTRGQVTLEATYDELVATIHAHPTLSEAVHEAAHASHGHAIHF